MYTSYSFIDASTEEYQEEEVYYQEEEDHFDQYTNQGKLIFLQSAKLPEQGTLTYYFMLHNPIPSFILTSFYFDY